MQADDSVWNILSVELLYCFSSTHPMVQSGGARLGADIQVCDAMKTMTTCQLFYLFYSQFEQLNLYSPA